MALPFLKRKKEYALFLCLFVFFVLMVYTGSTAVRSASVEIDGIEGSQLAKCSSFVIDRLEGEYAVCEVPSGEMFSCKLRELPKGCSEGDVIVRSEGMLQIDQKSTALQKKKADVLVRQLWE